MKKLRIEFFLKLLFVLLVFGAGYYFREDIGHVLNIAFRQSPLLNQLSLPKPCQKPITYSIANLDPRFNLSRDELLNYIEQAEKIWEDAIGKSLFEYSEAGDMKMSLIYDYRQKSTDELKKIGITIDDTQGTYDKLKTEYNSLIASYDKEKARIDTLIATYNTNKNAYEKDVKHWNTKGGAPEAEYKKLEQRRINLNNQVAVINQAQNSLNELVDTINSVSAQLNKLIVTLNLQVDTYNSVGSSTARTFSEGEYVSDASGTYINIYEFSNKNQLIRVLAHELGHALGLEHIDNKEAIMYYLNEGMNEKLTTDDLSALKNICAIR